MRLTEELVMIGPGCFIERTVHTTEKAPQVGYVSYEGQRRKVFIGFWGDSTVWNLVQGESDQPQYDYCATQTLSIEDTLEQEAIQAYYDNVNREYKRFYHTIGFPSSESLDTFAQDIEEYHVELEDIEFDHGYSVARCISDRLLMPGEIAKLAAASNVCYLMLNSTETI